MLCIRFVQLAPWVQAANGPAGVRWGQVMLNGVMVLFEKERFPHVDNEFMITDGWIWLCAKPCYALSI